MFEHGARRPSGLQAAGTEQEGDYRRRMGADGALQSRHRSHLDVDVPHAQDRTVAHTHVVLQLHGLKGIGAPQDVGAAVLQLGIQHLEHCAQLLGEDLEVVLRLSDLGSVRLEPGEAGRRVALEVGPHLDRAVGHFLHVVVLRRLVHLQVAFVWSCGYRNNMVLPIIYKISSF